MARTQHPVVLLHGVFGYGRTRPLWNRWFDYWPHEKLAALDAHYIALDLGVFSSDHDRACEAFYQLYGGRVDYGDAHAREFGHDRYGATFDTPLFPQWSAERPVHLLGHSLGATTALALYQLLAIDFFGVGSDHRWVHSIISIAGPLSGTTLPHYFGFYDTEPSYAPLTRVLSVGVCLWLRLQTQFPALRHVLDYRMPQWGRSPAMSWRQIFSARNAMLTSRDMSLFESQPAHRLARNAQLQHMDKLHLISIASGSRSSTPTTALALLVPVCAMATASAVALACGERTLAVRLSASTAAMWLWLRKRIVLPLVQWRMRRHTHDLPELFEGFNRAEWEANDGAINVCSMQLPRVVAKDDECSDGDGAGESDDDAASTASTASSSESVTNRAEPLALSRTLDERACGRPRQRGVWYTCQVPHSDHKLGTNFDRHATPAVLKQVLTLLADEFEDRIAR
ncbi:hypothetical protein ATCC90586_007958 [Pythium insidiosum]|nr:hypothetical protein ATCC90586_007958 [Pythium insidiosum]